MDLITIAAQLGFGLLIKKWPPLAAWPNRLIPVFNLGLAVLFKLAGVGVAQAQGLGVATHVAHPGWAALWCFLEPLVLNTLVATGVFSGVKNAQQHLSSLPATQ